MNKYSIGRLKRLLAMLKENRYPNFPRFLAEMKKTDSAGAYQLSARTLQRDIAFLKSEYHAPIQFDCTQKGYNLTIPDWSVDIPLLEDNEMQAAAARLADRARPTNPALRGRLGEREGRGVRTPLAAHPQWLYCRKGSPSRRKELRSSSE